MATVTSWGQYTVDDIDKKRIINLQYVDPYTDGITDTDLKYGFMIFLNRDVDTTGDQLLVNDEKLNALVYRANTKAYCDFYIVYNGTVESMQNDFSSIFDYIKLLEDNWTTTYNICIDWDNQGENAGVENMTAAFQEAFYASVHWCRMLTDLNEVDINCSYADESIVDAGIETYFQDWINVYSNLEDLTFSDSEVQEAYDQEKANVLKYISELTSKPEFLTYNEMFAIMLYSSNFYWVINRALRSPATYASEYDELRGVFININTGLWLFTQYLGNTWRGDNLSADRIEANEPGKSVTNLAYTSTSTSISTDFIANSQQVFNFSLIDGSSISVISLYPNEDEILVKADMTYYVVNNTEKFQDTDKTLYEVSELKTIRR